MSNNYESYRKYYHQQIGSKAVHGSELIDSENVCNVKKNDWANTYILDSG